VINLRARENYTSVVFSRPLGCKCPAAGSLKLGIAAVGILSFDRSADLFLNSLRFGTSKQ
jgi:hypothetical protein